MADSTTNIDTITNSESDIEARVNENFDAASAAMAFGRHGSACVGLTFAIYGGVALVSGVPTLIANQTFSLTASVTNYIRRNVNGSFTVTTSAPTGWPLLAADAVALYSVVTGASTVTSYADLRLASGAAGSPGTSPIGIRYTFSTTTTDSDPGSGFLRLSNATQNTATVIRTDLLDELAVDWTAVLDTLDASSSTVKGQVRISKYGDQTKWLTFNLTARATPAGYRNLTVTNTGSSAASPFANNDHVLFEFSRTGDIGAIGPTGPTGPTGTSGAAGLSYTYSTTTTAADPGSGVFRLNNATLASATALYISETDGNTNAIAAEIATWDDSTSTNRCKIKIQKTSDPTKFVEFYVTGTLTDNGTWDTLTVAYITGSTLANNDVCTLLVVSTGDKGVNGTSPLTTKGDVYTYDSADARLAVGTDGQVLTADNAQSKGVKWATASSGDLVKIAQVVTASSAATITFSSIPSTYSNLKIIIVGRDTSTGVASSHVRMKINGDATAGNYTSTQFMEQFNGTVGAGTITSTVDGGVPGYIPGTSGLATAVGSIEITIAGYAGTVFQKIIQSVNSENINGGLAVNARVFVWASAAAINAIVFKAGTTAFVDGTTATLYGMN